MHVIRVVVKHQDHSYDINIKPGIFKKWRELVVECARGGKILSLVDRNLMDIPAFQEECGSAHSPGLLMVTPGEARKNLAQYSELCEAALGQGLDRNSLLVAVGGGVTGDLAGFLAATLLRGLRLVQIPTTLLAQVDSSVGGKTGVNSAAGKNLVGAFHQPEQVIIDPTLLLTLPDREFLAGLAEVVKTGVLAGPELFNQLRHNQNGISRRDPEVLAQVIRDCCHFKAEVVMADERETGKRAMLNLGHTFGHALETLAGFNGSVLHGEAVAVGTRLAVDFSRQQGGIAPEAAQAIRDCLQAFGLPDRISRLGTGPFKPDWQELFQGKGLEEALGHDKKVGRQGLTLVIPKGIGEWEIQAGVALARVAEHLRNSLAAE